MTDEDRANAAIKRKADQQWALDNIKTEYVDKPLWSELASSQGVKLPLWWKPASETRYVKRVAKKVGVDINLFVQATGFNTLKEFVSANPKLSAVGLVGLYLEEAQDIKSHSHVYPVQKDSKSKGKE
jgi:hypothetical protein